MGSTETLASQASLASQDLLGLLVPRDRRVRLARMGWMGLTGLTDWMARPGQLDLEAPKALKAPKAPKAPKARLDRLVWSRPTWR
jgi:hypothetical protein